MADTPSQATDWAKTVAIVISFVALAQPWVIALYKKYWRRRALVIVPSGRLEVAFSLPFASNLTIKGSIYSKNRASLIRTMNVSVQHEQTDYTRELKAHLLRDPKLTFGSNVMTASAEMAGAIHIDEDEIASFYITFIDYNDFNGFELTAPRTYKKWEDFMAPRLLDYIKKIGPRPTDQEKAIAYETAAQPFIETSFSEFLNTAPAQAIANELRALFHWPEGTYRMTLSCEVQDDRHRYAETWRFSMDPLQVGNLQNNVTRMMRDMCQLTTAGFAYCAYPHYQPLG
jgi:hypothetical protein